MQYAGYYTHAPSSLNLTMARNFSPALTAWLNREPLGNFAGPNLTRFASGNPISFVDRLGGYPLRSPFFSTEPGILSNAPPWVIVLGGEGVSGSPFLYGPNVWGIFPGYRIPPVSFGPLGKGPFGHAPCIIQVCACDGGNNNGPDPGLAKDWPKRQGVGSWAAPEL